MTFNDNGHLRYSVSMQYRLHINPKREQLLNVTPRCNDTKTVISHEKKLK